MPPSPFVIDAHGDKDVFNSGNSVTDQNSRLSMPNTAARSAY